VGEDMSHLLVDMRMPTVVMNAVRRNFMYVLDEHHDLGHSSIVGSLPAHLKTRLVQAMFRKYLKKSETLPLLNELDHDFPGASAIILSRVACLVYTDEDKDLLGNELGHSYLAFVVQGTCTVHFQIDGQSKSEYKVGAGQWYGEDVLISSSPLPPVDTATLTVTSVTASSSHVVALTLTASDCAFLRDVYPLVFETMFEQMKASRDGKLVLHRSRNQV